MYNLVKCNLFFIQLFCHVPKGKSLVLCSLVQDKVDHRLSVGLPAPGATAGRGSEAPSPKVDKLWRTNWLLHCNRCYGRLADYIMGDALFSHVTTILPVYGPGPYTSLKVSHLVLLHAVQEPTHWIDYLSSIDSDTSLILFCFCFIFCFILSSAMCCLYLTVIRNAPVF